MRLAIFYDGYAYAILPLMKAWAPSVTKRQGFTIVELLIVIVVIAILAAITIVAYNGIQNRAKDTALQSASSQAGKKVLAYGPTHSDTYPDETSFRTDLALPANTDQLTYDYYTNTSQKTFCISVTNTTTSPLTAYAVTQDGKTVPGRCVKNQAANPSLEGGTTAFYGLNSSVTSIGVQTGSAPNGTRFLRVTRTATGDTYASYTTSNTANANSPYTLSFWIWADTNAGLSGIAFRTYNAGACCVNIGSSLAVSVTPTPTRYAISGTSGSNPTTGLQTILRATGTVDQNIYYDGLMMVEGSTEYAYGDGNSANWSWVGTQNTSASFGPALPI